MGSARRGSNPLAVDFEIAICGKKLFQSRHAMPAVGSGEWQDHRPGCSPATRREQHGAGTCTCRKRQKVSHIQSPRFLIFVTCHFVIGTIKVLRVSLPPYTPYKWSRILTIRPYLHKASPTVSDQVGLPRRCVCVLCCCGWGGRLVWGTSAGKS